MESFKGHLKQILGSILFVLLCIASKIAYDRYQESERKREFMIINYDLKLEKRGEVGNYGIYQVYDKDEKAGFITLPLPKK